VWAGRNWSTLTLRASDTSALPGYQTITFASPLPVIKGGKFIVAIKLVSPTELYPLACEVANDSWQAGATASAGQSYIRYGDGDPWDDISASEHANVCLKAFAN
jgi:hypothetical protein